MDDDGMGCWYIVVLIGYALYKWLQGEERRAEELDRTDFPV